MIIRYVAASDEGGTLAALLRTNKYVCSATLPIMYEKSLLWRLNVDYSYHDDTLAGLLPLNQLLLRSVPKDRITPLLKAAYLDNGDQATVERENEEQLTVATAVSNNNSNPTKISYLAFVTTIDIQIVFHQHISFFYNKTLDVNTHLSNELESGGYSERYLVEGVNDHLKYYDPDKVIHLGAARDLRRDLTWALSVNAENIRSIVIPLADLARYLEQVHRFKVLADVTFLIDRDLRYSQRNGRELSTQDQEMLRFQRIERIRHYEEMLSFVQKHRQIHMGVLRTGRCIPDKITMPLRRFRAAYDHRSAGSHLNDVLYAFNDTLEYVTVTGIWSSNQLDFHGLAEFLI
ncbi:hypothetical protein BGX24_006341, partial [Mortierella sp. AD032]